MKKICLVLMCLAALALTACGGGKSGGSASGGSESGSNAGGLADGQWPAAIYDKYGIPEIETKGKIVFTELTDEDKSYQYRVNYKGVTKEELQAWVKKLEEKGFRIPKYTKERFNAGRSDLDAIVYQPEQGKDIGLRVAYDFEHDMDFEYYADEHNPAFEITERDEQYFIVYNFAVSLFRINNAPETEGAFEALGVKAEDLKGVKFYHTFSGKELTADELKAQKIRGYVVEKDGQKYQMMGMTDDRVGDFGGSINFRFVKTNK